MIAASTATTSVETSSQPQQTSRQYLLVISFWATLLYLLLEIAYNVGLVRMLSTPGLTKSTVEGMEVVGKVMASIGITLFVSRLFPLKKVWRYTVLALITYASLGLVVDRAIDQLPESTKRAGHWLGMYRVAALEGRIADSDLVSLDPEPATVQRMALVNMALLAYADNGDVEVATRKYLVAKVDDHIDYTAIEHDFDQFWKAYSYASAKLKPVWDWYRSETLKQEHRVPTMGEFVQAVEQSNRFGRRMAEYNSTVLYQGNHEVGLPAVTAREVPLFLSKAQLRKHFHGQIEGNKLVAANHFTPGTGTSQLTRDLSASVFIPPVSMTLSLISILLNAASLAGILGVYLFSALSVGRASFRAQKAVQCAIVGACLAIVATGSGPTFAEGSKFSVAAERAAQQGPLQKLWVEAISKESVIVDTIGSWGVIRAVGDVLPTIGSVFTNDKR